MLKAAGVLFLVAAVAFAGNARGTGEPTYAAPRDDAGESRAPVHVAPGKSADVLFLFAAYNYSGQFAWANQYWNPTDDGFPTAWSYNTINPSTAEPDGSPYHWNGGMGTALDNLGITWEWYATYDGEDIAEQVLPDVSMMLSDYDLVIFWVGDYWDPSRGPALTAATMADLESYMTSGGPLFLMGQDIEWSGVPMAWLNTWFGTGTTTQDVLSGEPLVAASGITGTPAEGWSGTALVDNFYVSPGSFFPDDMELNGIIGDATYEFACYDDTNKRLYTTVHFETCVATEVEALMDLLMTWVGTGGALEQSTWGSIKADF
jgi:hypothetical protein